MDDVMAVQLEKTTDTYWADRSELNVVGRKDTVWAGRKVVRLDYHWVAKMATKTAELLAVK